MRNALHLRSNRTGYSSMTASSPTKSWPAWLLYVAPMAAFSLVFSLQDQFATEGQPTRQAIFYMAAISVVALVAWLCRETWVDLRPWPTWPQIALSILVGVLVIVAWVGLDPYYWHPSFLGKRTSLDPGTITNPGVRLAYLLFRAFGLVLVVPLMEELFWRSFLMRWIIDSEFEKVPVGKVTLLAAGITSAMFALAHPEWLPAVLTGLAWAGLLAYTGKLSTCWISHMTANAVLGAYVLWSGNWIYV